MDLTYYPEEEETTDQYHQSSTGTGGGGGGQNPPPYTLGIATENEKDRDRTIKLCCFTMKKTVGTAVIVNLIGIALFLSGIFLILYTSNKDNPCASGDCNQNQPWMPPNTKYKKNRIGKTYLLATILATVGGFLIIFGSAWYCFVKKNITKRDPNTHIVVPSEYDSKEPQTAYTDIGGAFSEMNDTPRIMETGFGRGGGGAGDDLRRSVIMKNSLRVVLNFSILSFKILFFILCQ